MRSFSSRTEDSTSLSLAVCRVSSEGSILTLSDLYRHIVLLGRSLESHAPFLPMVFSEEHDPKIEAL